MALSLQPISYVIVLVFVVVVCVFVAAALPPLPFTPPYKLPRIRMDELGALLERMELTRVCMDCVRSGISRSLCVLQKHVAMRLLNSRLNFSC